MKAKRLTNDKGQNVANIYKKSQLNIAHFLSNYGTKPKSQKSSKKRRKSGRALAPNSAYKMNPNRFNVRSRSNFRETHSRNNERPSESPENIINLNLSSTQPRVRDIMKELSGIKLKTTKNRRKSNNPAEIQYQTTITQPERKTKSNRTDSGLIRKGDTEIIEKLYRDLKLKSSEDDTSPISSQNLDKEQIEYPSGNIYNFCCFEM